MIATYRLSKHIASFEFFYWLVMVQEAGAKKIVFDLANPKARKFTLDDMQERFRSIIEPGPALAGLPYRFSLPSDAALSSLDATAIELLPWYLSGKRFARLKTVKRPCPCDYTVTIRRNRAGKPERDSKLDAWLLFAKDIGAVVIEDYYDRPIHLHDRMALYAGAKMNYGVCNGPIAILGLTEYPVTMFVNSQSARQSNMRQGLEENEKYPWMLRNQSMVWKEDTIDELRRTFEAQFAEKTKSE